MNEWMDGDMDTCEWVRWMDGRTEGQTDEWTDGQIGTWIQRWWVDEMDGWMDGQMGTWIQRW